MCKCVKTNTSPIAMACTSDLALLLVVTIEFLCPSGESWDEALVTSLASDLGNKASI